MRTGNERFALYAVPERDSPLGRAGFALLGRDEAGRAITPLASSLGLDEDWYAARSRDARRYGLHATLKPPFRLADGTTRDDLERSVADLAARLAPIADVPLALSELHGFLALRPASPAPALDAVADAAVRDLDSFRAPPASAELARRRANGLNAAQTANLERWGYPYVFDEFRFHLTLSDRLPDDERAHLRGRLAPSFDGLRLDLTDLALCVEPTPGADFILLRRFALGGDTP